MSWTAAPVIVKYKAFLDHCGASCCIGSQKVLEYKVGTLKEQIGSVAFLVQQKSHRFLDPEYLPSFQGIY